MSGAGGKNKTRSCREKLNELLEYVKMDVMKEPQAGIELGLEALTKGVFHPQQLHYPQYVHEPSTILSSFYKCTD